MHLRVHAAGLQHRAVGGEISEEHGQAALLAVGIAQRTNDVAVLHDRIADVLAERLAGHGDAVEIAAYPVLPARVLRIALMPPAR